MEPKMYGIEHIIYLIITTALAVSSILLVKKYVKTEKGQKIYLKILGALLLIFILANRLSQVFCWGSADYTAIIPNSFCGMTSLVLSLGVLFGKKDNIVLHFAWLLGIFGGISTVVYPTFVGQNSSFFFLPTITGLLHHSLSATTVVALLIFRYVDVSYKKWYAPLFGLTAYMAVGAFLMGVIGESDAFHIVEPLISGTPFTAWVMAPIYFVSHGLIFVAIEFFRKRKTISKSQ